MRLMIDPKVKRAGNRLEEYQPKKSLKDLGEILKVSFWYLKIKKIDDQLNKLEKVANIETISISVFLLRCQFLEFRIKNLISNFDLHLFMKNTSKLIWRVIRKPTDKSLERLTLGNLLKELKKYNSEMLTDLIESLKILVEWRNTLTHRLFSKSYTLEEIEFIAKNGIPFAKTVDKMISKIEIKLDEERNETE